MIAKWITLSLLQMCDVHSPENYNTFDYVCLTLFWHFL